MSCKANAMTQPASPDLTRKGYENLVQQLGVNQATRFVVALERGKGDTILDVQEYWKDATVHDIHEQIVGAKNRGELLL